jgi:hypothetical protein
MALPPCLVYVLMVLCLEKGRFVIFHQFYKHVTTMHFVIELMHL